MTVRLIFFLLAGAVFLLLCIQPVMADEALEKIVHVDLLQGTNKVGWSAVDWNLYGNKMKEKGYLNEAKEAYYKSYNSMKGDILDITLETEVISGIANIEVEQGNPQKALELYDKVCPDNRENNADLLGNKAKLVRSMGDTARADMLEQSAKRIGNKPYSGGWGLDLDPLIIIIGLIGAVLIIGKKHTLKQ